MTKTVFTKVDYDLGTLVKYIELGEIGLPDIQRPFVWNNAKARDLFDSMYRGYPVGYLLLWRNGLVADERTIGTDAKQMPPRLVIVDGQQRLTSLYAVVKAVSVVRQNYESERITIAFNPLEERFEVADAAIRRDKTFLPDISTIWTKESNLFKVANDYLADLQATRPVSNEEVMRIQTALTRLQGLLNFPFTALELVADISEEDVSEVFVRINSKGTPLNQADFILTLMSVFWDEGRADLEQFCAKARKPSKDTVSPFNYFIEPSPDQMLRVGVGLAFKRARLKYVYSILRGKDLATEQFSDERRIEQFARLQRAQAKALNVQYWHDFLGCIRAAGFRSDKMISSENNLLFSYILYLIGRTEIGVEPFALRKVIAQWFFMSAATGRFTGSPESAMEFDLANLREVSTPEEFVSRLKQVCEITLTNDFWDVTLPNDLATSAPRSPSLFAYNAALVLLDARALFSDVKIADLFDPALHATKNAVERHHLFPKGHLLERYKLTSTRDTNQIANYAYVEWLDNIAISDSAPATYLPTLSERFNPSQLAEMYHHHALPEGWERMDYRVFLEHRRELMAQITREGYQVLAFGPREAIRETPFDLVALLENGESDALEFKSTLRINLHTGESDKRMETAVLKTLAGFLNTNGGTLVIGVADDGSPVGIERDRFPNEDNMSLHFVNLVNSRMGPHVMTNMHVHFEDYEGSRVMVVRCSRSATPVYTKDGDTEKFYIRTGPSTAELQPSQIQTYIQQRFSR